MTLTASILSTVPGDPLTGLRRVDETWQAYRADTLPSPVVMATDSALLPQVEWDVVICGGTLGILLGCTLVQQGWRVALIERGVLRGREQEWNISRQELQVFRSLDLLSAAELEQAIATEYNPARLRFGNGTDIWVRDVLNTGVDPVYLLETLKQKFLAAGGRLVERAIFETATMHPNGVEVVAGESFHTRLLVDAMGHFSPIARQARRGQKPDAVCLVVGTCAAGFPANETGDLFATLAPIQNQCQYFWEAFPARDGRTTYLFTYVDAHPDRPSLEHLFEDYFRLLPDYQQVSLDQLQIKRALFGFFPCYRHSPLQPQWHRLVHGGDSSGNQSPLSFGGFGAMVRHLQRLTQGIDSALTLDRLDRHALGLLQPYQPNLSVTWLFQRSMSIGIHQTLPPDQINQLLAAVFEEMVTLGDPVLKPFLQDVVQFGGLSQTLLKTAIAHPALIAAIIPHVGVGALLDWMRHYINLGIYAGLATLEHPLQPWVKLLPPSAQYTVQRSLEAWKYGSGADYHP